MGTFILRLTIWLLLTGIGGWENVLLGVVLALLLPRPFATSASPVKLLRSLGAVLAAIPLAYFEAVGMILFPHRQERMSQEKGRQPPLPDLVFLDILRITFTPKTLVVRDLGTAYEVHHLERRRSP
jgi:multicomponent Na+:H+ antiporter subunit E